MDLYKIVHDEDEFNFFLINVLPNLKDNERYYLSLFSRKKYCQNLIKSNDKTQLKRFTSNKERMLVKIQQLEIPVGRWLLREMEAPQESLVLYISPNPRDMKKATEAMGKKCWDLARSDNFNLHQEAMSCIQRSAGQRKYVHFDIDTKDVDLSILEEIFPFVDAPRKTYWIIETRGGYHILVDSFMAKFVRHKYNLNQNWYQEIVESFPLDKSSKPELLPVPGCIQGGFVPKIVNK